MKTYPDLNRTSRRIQSKLDLNKGKSYSNNSSLLLDLEVEDKDSATVLTLIRQHASFENGYISLGTPDVLIGDRLSVFLMPQSGILLY